jgi:hypothetical protein
LVDYDEALFAQPKVSSERKILILVIGSVLSLFVVFLMVTLGFRQGSLQVGVIIFWFASWIVFKLARPVWVNRDFRQHPNFSRKQILRIDEDGLHATSEIGQSERTWRAYTKYRETQNLFVLYLGARLIEVIPKRAFSAPQLEEFRDLLHRNLSQVSLGKTTET